jgi:hypothetical protein
MEKIEPSFKIDKETVKVKRAKLQWVKEEMKKLCFGKDYDIDTFIQMVESWYIFSDILYKPTIINLWGMTSNGKTSLFSDFAKLIGMYDKFCKIDMSESEDMSGTEGYNQGLSLTSNRYKDQDIRSKISEISEKLNDKVIILLDDIHKSCYATRRGLYDFLSEGTIVSDQTLLQSMKKLMDISNDVYEYYERESRIRNEWIERIEDFYRNEQMYTNNSLMIQGGQSQQLSNGFGGNFAPSIFQNPNIAGDSKSQRYINGLNRMLSLGLVSGQEIELVKNRYFMTFSDSYVGCGTSYASNENNMNNRDIWNYTSPISVSRFVSNVVDIIELTEEDVVSILNYNANTESNFFKNKKIYNIDDLKESLGYAADQPLKIRDCFSSKMIQMIHVKRAPVFFKKCYEKLMKKISETSEKKNPFIASNTLILITGNVDKMYLPLDTDHDADMLFEKTRKLTMKDLYQAVVLGDENSRGFLKPEEFARHGGLHIISSSISKEGFDKIIEKEVKIIERDVKVETGFTIEFTKSKKIYDMIYDEDFAPSQGARPVKSKLNNIVSSIIPDLILSCLETDKKITGAEIDKLLVKQMKKGI